MGLWCNLLFRVMLDAGCGQGWSALACTLLGLVVYSAALLAQGITFSPKKAGKPSFNPPAKGGH